MKRVMEVGGLGGVGYKLALSVLKRKFPSLDKPLQK